MNTNWHDLIQRYITGTITDAEAAALEQQIKTDAALRDWYLDAVNLDLALEVTAESAEVALSLPVPPSQRVLAPASPHPSRWYSWRPITAAAAGIVFGMLCTSMVFGLVVPMARLSTLLDDSFEVETKLTSKVSLEPGAWRSNHAVIVGSEQGVQPAIGDNMLRLLHADFNGGAKSDGDHLADAYHLLDLRRYRQGLDSEDCVVQVAASFNASLFSMNEKYGCAVSVYALDAENAPDGPRRIGTALSEDHLAMARSRSTQLDHTPGTWQRLSTELRLPPNTDYIVVRLHITQAFDAGQKPPFTGSYVDDVSVILIPRSVLP